MHPESATPKQDGRECDILLIHTHRDHFGAVPEDISIGLNVLAAFLRENGHPAAIFRGPAHEAAIHLEHTMRNGGVRSIGFYCDHENVSLVTNFSRLIKDRWGIPVFIGGPQTVGLGEDFFRESRCDVIVRGEGEFVLLELLNTFLYGKGKLGKINGISYLDPSGKLVHCSDREPISDLDALPWPDFRQEPGGEHWHVLPVITGRGCPYRCAFCYEGGNTRKVRFRSVGNVMGEIAAHFESLPRIRYVFFVDDTFTLKPDRVLEFCRKLTNLRKKRDFVWFCEGHIQTLYKWPHILTEMAKAGCAKIFLGIESGSNEVLELYQKKTNIAMIEKVVGDCIDAGIPQVTGNIIIGGPRETPETVDASWRLIERLLRLAPGRFDSLSFFLVPYPNTAIQRTPEKFGIRLLRSREKHVLEDFPLTETEALSWSDLYQLRSDFNRKVSRLMENLYQEGKVEHSTMLTNQRLMLRYGVMSRWLLNLMSKYPADSRYYQLLAEGDAVRSTEINAPDRDNWYPQRVFEIWDSLHTDEGYPRLGSAVLSPLEYDLLLRCSGKMKLRQLLNDAYNAFIDRFENRVTFEKDALRILSEFESRRWITYARF